MVSQFEPQETNNTNVEGEDASPETTRSFSKMSIKSCPSNVSVKSKSGSKTSLNDDSKESPKVFSCLAEVTYISFLGYFCLKVDTQTLSEGVQETMENPSAYIGTPSSLSHSSIKSKSSKSSVKVDSGSQTSLKKGVTTSTEVCQICIC